MAPISDQNQTTSGTHWPSRGQRWPTLTGCGPSSNSGDSGPTLRHAGRRCPTLADTNPTVSEFGRPSLGRMPAKFDVIGANQLADPGPTSADNGRTQCRPNSARTWRSLNDGLGPIGHAAQKYANVFSYKQKLSMSSLNASTPIAIGLSQRLVTSIERRLTLLHCCSSRQVS